MWARCTIQSTADDMGAAWQKWFTAAEGACEKGDVAYLQALCEASPVPTTRFAQTWAYRIMAKVCVTGGHVHVAQWVASRYGALRDREYFLKLALTSGHLPLAQWFLTGDNTLMDKLEWHLGWVCLAGQLEVAQWMHETCHRGTFDAFADDAFLQACSGGHVHVARWLLSLGAVDVEACALDALHTAVCTDYGNLAVAKWLVSLGTVDIHAVADDLASWCRQNGAPFGSVNWHACRWLFSLDPREAAWPAAIVRVMSTWSPARDAWMRSCVVAARAPTKS